MAWDLLPPAARAALLVPSVAERAAAPAQAPAQQAAAHAGGAEGALSELDTREGPVRYAAYAGRTAQFVRAAERVASVRHLAYASDVGEAFRPAVPSWAVNATYAIAFGYVAADVAHQTARVHAAGAPADEVTRTAVQTATFQLLASIAAPFVVIHTAVDLAKRSLAHTRAARIGPVIAGLALIPALPLVDHPIEHAVEAAFDSAWPRSAEGAAAAARMAAAAGADVHAKHA